MSNTKTLIELIDEYTETRHRCGCATYNAKTEEARKAVIKALSGGQALSAAPEAFLKSVIALCSHRGYSPTNIEAWDKNDKWIADLWRQAEAMLAASPTPPAEQQAITPETGNSVSAQGAAITSESGAVYAELPKPNLPRGGFPDLFTERQMRDFADRTHALRMQATKAAPAWADQVVIEYRYTGGTHWCPLGPAERMKSDFDGVYRLQAGVYPAEQAAAKAAPWEWTEQDALGILNQLSDGPFGQGDVDDALDFMRLVDTARRDKAAPGEPIAWTPGPNLFKDWCAQWFGPDSDDDYLAKAVFNLPPMAQVFKEAAPQQAAPKAAPGDEGKALAALRYYMNECSGAEPSISVFHRMVEEALGAAPQQEAQEPGEIDRLRAALVYTAFALHGTPQYMLADGITLIDGDAVQVSRDGWKVQASINPLRQSAQPAPQPAPVRDYPPLPKPDCPNIWGGAYSKNQMHAYVDADRAALAARGGAA